MLTKRCSVCGDSFPAFDGMGHDIDGGVCVCCLRMAAFAAFARKHGLRRYPDPSGERYVYLSGEGVYGCCAGKKGENVDFIDELWDALVRASGGDPSLLIGGAAR